MRHTDISRTMCIMDDHSARRATHCHADASLTEKTWQEGDA